MDVVSIFLTDSNASVMDDFIHAGRRYSFTGIDDEGPQRLVEGPVWVFIDWVLPGLAGLEMCRRLRSDPRMREAHITMVLEADDPEDRRRALKAGADDYMLGPIDRTAVLDRVIAVDPQQRPRAIGQRYEVGDLTIDLVALQARWADKAVVLPPNEFRLLLFFAENPNRVMTREQLIAGLGKQEPAIDTRTVDVWIGRLRSALKAAGAGNPLRTVRSVGYVLDLS